MPHANGLELNNKNNQVAVGIRNHVFGTIFHKFHAQISRFRHNFVIFHGVFPTLISTRTLTASALAEPTIADDIVDAISNFEDWLKKNTPRDLPPI